MSVLGALKDYYDRVAEDENGGIAPFGYSEENISFALILGADGSFVDYRDLRQTSGRRLVPQLMQVPRAVKRTVAVAPNFLWDKTSYALGQDPEPDARTMREHEVFNALHRAVLAGTDDEGLRALLAFLEQGAPVVRDRLPEDVLGTNVVFQLDGERRYLHQRPAARAIWARTLAEAAGREGLCLVSGERAPLARLHPSIKGVRGAQSAGASIVSFNLDAFTSYGKDQGENAPVSEEAAFAYVTALNHLLRPNSRNRVQIADASTVFWAESPAPAEEQFVGFLFEPPAESDDGPPGDVRVDPGEAGKVRDILARMAKGRPLAEAAPELRPETRFFVLGLTPNAARVAIRFWHTDSLGNLARRFAEHHADLAIEPPPRRASLPAVRRLLYETAVQHKVENVPSNLAGEVMRSVLTGGRYPRTLLAAAVMRMRADGVINGLRAAIVKACLARDFRKGIEKEDVPMGLDKADPNPGYRLGRLFAVLEAAQVAALGNVNASIRDRYYGAASATPTSVFPLLIGNYRNHLKNVRTKKGDRLANWYEKHVGEIVDGLAGRFPRSLSLEDQGRFAIGYYHEREALFRRKDPETPAELADADQSETTEDDEA